MIDLRLLSSPNGRLPLPLNPPAGTPFASPLLGFALSGTPQGLRAVVLAQWVLQGDASRRCSWPRSCSAPSPLRPPRRRTPQVRPRFLLSLSRLPRFSIWFGPDRVFLVAIAEVVSGFLSNAASAVLKRLWSLKSTVKTGDC